MSSFLLRVVDVSLGIVGLYLLKKVLSKSPSAPLPPGPKKRFLIGNLLDVPTDYAWYEWSKHKQLYGKSHQFMFLLTSICHFLSQMFILCGIISNFNYRTVKLPQRIWNAYYHYQ